MGIEPSEGGHPSPMASMKYFLPTLALSFVIFAGTAPAQTSSLAGVVKGPDGAPLKDALIKIDRKDIKGHYEVKTKKKGDYFHAGLPLGTYHISVVVDGKEMDSVDNVRTRLGDPTEINFDLQAIANRQKAMQKAAETGQVTAEVARDMTPEQKQAYEKSMKERTQQLQKNKALNDQFNQGKEAMNNKQWDVAVQAFSKASEMDPKQNVIWGNMAEAYSEMAKTKTGADKDAALAKSLESYQKALELAPADASYHNNYALALARAGKFPEMQDELSKAVQLDTANAGKYYYNLGAVLVNSNQLQPACDAFDKAIAADANYADAYYQRGMCLTAKATNTADGKVVFPPGTAEAFQKYLELKPDGVNAASAKGMLDAMGQKIQTEYVAPGAKPAPGDKKKKK